MPCKPPTGLGHGKTTKYLKLGVLFIYFQLARTGFQRPGGEVAAAEGREHAAPNRLVVHMVGVGFMEYENTFTLYMVAHATCTWRATKAVQPMARIDIDSRT